MRFAADIWRPVADVADGPKNGKITDLEAAGY
jgi:hypothetical protein